MRGLETHFPANALRQPPKRAHRIIHQRAAAQAIKMRVLLASVVVFVEKSALIHRQALQRAASNEQIERAVDRGARNALATAVQTEEHVVRREVPAKRGDEIENHFALACAPRGRGFHRRLDI